MNRYLEMLRRAVLAIQACDLSTTEREGYMARLRRELDGETPEMKHVICQEWRCWFRQKRLQEVKALRAKRQSATLDPVKLA